MYYGRDYTRLTRGERASGLTQPNEVGPINALLSNPSTHPHLSNAPEHVQAKNHSCALHTLFTGRVNLQTYFKAIC